MRSTLGAYLQRRLANSNFFTIRNRWPSLQVCATNNKEGDPMSKKYPNIKTHTANGVVAKPAREFTPLDVVALHDPTNSDNAEQPLFLRGSWDMDRECVYLICLNGIWGRDYHSLRVHEDEEIFKVGSVVDMTVHKLHDAITEKL